MKAVQIWADGHGRWYAEVPAADPAMQRRTAREAIRQALAERGQIGPGYRLQVEPAPAYYGPGAIYREAWA